MADMKPQGTQAYGIETGYEHGDANVGAVVSGMTIILTSTLVVMAAMFAMFNYLNKQADKADAKAPLALTQTVIPPSPRLLPNPYTDRYRELDEAKAKYGLTGDTPDPLPWDKRTLEISKQEDESNPSAEYMEVLNQKLAAEARKTGQPVERRIPVAAAMELEAGVKPGQGIPAAMAWQEDYAPRVAGKTDGGMNLNIDKKKAVGRTHRTFDERAAWESPDEQFSTDSGGGANLGLGGKNLNDKSSEAGWSH